MPGHQCSPPSSTGVGSTGKPGTDEDMFLEPTWNPAPDKTHPGKGTPLLVIIYLIMD